MTVRRNFVLSVWLLIGFCAVRFAVRLVASDLDEAYGPFSTRVLLWPLGLGLMELALWFRPFRHAEPGARIMAGFMGLMLLLKPVLTAVLITSLYGIPSVSRPEWWLYMYVGVSHVAYAVLGREEG